MLTAGFVAIPPATSMALLLPAFALLAIGQGLCNPSIQSLVSRIAPVDWQGGALGGAQAAGSMGRVLGPVSAGIVFTVLGRDWPFLGGAMLLVPVVVLAVYAGRLIRRRSSEQ